MSRGLARHAGWLAALAAVLVGLAAAPAAAAPGGPKITFEGPRADPPLESSSVTVSGSVEVQGLSLHRLRDVTLTMAGQTKTIPCSDSSCPFTWTVTISRNGPYRVDATARQTLVVGNTAGPESDPASRRFSVAAPPKKPALDKPTVTEERTVELSWAANPEPDMMYYAVFRKDPGSSKLRQIGGKVDHPSSGTKVRFTDASTALTGGEYTYQVVAVRRGADGTDGTEVTSDPSSAGTASVPVPPTTTTAAADPGAPPVGNPTTTVKPGAAAGVDLSGFLSSRSQPVTLSPITVPEPPDTGFAGTLPFGSLPAGEELEEGEEEAVPPGDVQRRSVFTRIDSGRPLVPVAGGLVLLLLATHLRVLNHRIKVAPDGDLPVDGPAPAEAGAEASAPVVTPEPVVRPGPALYDVVAEEGWDDWDDEEWAPAADAAQPEAEPVALAEPEPVHAQPDSETEPAVLLAPEPEPEPEPAVLLAPEPQPEPEVLLAPEPEPEPAPVALWDSPPADEPGADEEEIEVFEVVSPTSRRLVRAGSR